MRYETRTLDVAFKNMQLVDVVPVFSILALGIVVAVCVVLLERALSPQYCKDFPNTSSTQIVTGF